MTAPSPRSGSPLGTASGTSDATSFAVTLPTHAAGDTFVACLATDGVPTLSCTGWTIVQQNNAAGSVAKGVIFRRDTVAASSSETNPTFLSDGAQQYAAAVYAIPGSQLLDVESTNGLNGTSTAPDGPSLSPPGGSRDYLWITACATDNGAVVVTDAPSGYSGLLSVSNGNGNGAAVGVAHKQATASSENPGAFTINAAEQWAAFTIAVSEPPPPAVAARGGTALSLGIG